MLISLGNHLEGAQSWPIFLSGIHFAAGDVVLNRSKHMRFVYRTFEDMMKGKVSEDTMEVVE